jgi:molecular chaperone DnaK (HSP70)
MAFLELKVLNNAPDKILGIDLGTTNSLAAVFRNGRPEVLRTHPTDARIPSVIHFPREGSPIVGRAAREYAFTDPGRTLFSVKRFMGRGLDDVAGDLDVVPFPVSETANGLLQLEIRKKLYTPQELSALILMRVHDVACKQLEGGMMNRIVLTVPAYFDDAQRQATRDAAKLAGLDVARIINEPTAASLAYGLDQRKQGTVAVFDLGGGTFDISILSIEDGVFRVLSTAGDTRLGGDDLDRALVELALEELRDQVGARAQEPTFLRGLHLAAEKCKIQL